MQVAALQFDIKRAASDASAIQVNLISARDCVRAAAKGGAKLVVLPEVWATSFPAADASCDQRLVDAAAEAIASVAAWSVEFGIVIAGSYLAPAPDLGKLGAGRFFNRLLVHDGADGGEVVLSYDKVHLFSPTAEHEVFAAGDLPPAIVDCSAGRLSGAICYDLRFPELFVPMRRADVDVIVVPAQWAVRRAAHWRALVLGRAVEAQATVIAANRTGEEPLGQRGHTAVFPGNSLIASAGGEAIGEGVGEVGPVFGLASTELSRKQRVRVPVAKDRRESLYQSWAQE
jgi:predicted amidohydrolase